VAQCTGPSMSAYSTLIDRHDGTYELIIRPQESGLHKLEITYGCEPIPGLSFLLLLLLFNSSNSCSSVHSRGKI